MGRLFDEPNDLIDFPEVYLQLSKRPERRRQMTRAVTEYKGYSKNYQSLLQHCPDLTERIFYGSPRFIQRRERAHAAALERLPPVPAAGPRTPSPGLPKAPDRISPSSCYLLFLLVLTGATLPKLSLNPFFSASYQCQAPGCQAPGCPKEELSKKRKAELLIKF